MRTKYIATSTFFLFSFMVGICMEYAGSSLSHKEILNKIKDDSSHVNSTEGKTTNKIPATTTKIALTCPSGDIVLSSQAQVTAFSTTYSGCTEIQGNLEISGTDITNLAALSQIMSVGGDVIIHQNTSLTSLSGLSNIHTIGGGLVIDNNPHISTIDGFNALLIVGKSLWIFENPILESVSGFGNLSSIKETIGFSNNPLLTSIGGFSQLTIAKEIYIEGNPSLESISGLSIINPERISGNGITLVDNPKLANCNLVNFCTYLSGAGQRKVEGNAASCSDIDGIVGSCNEIGVSANYCFPISSVVSGSGIYISSFTTSGAYSNISNTSSGYTNYGFGDFSNSHTVEQYSGDSFDFSLEQGFDVQPTHVKIWVDWNHDKVFETSELLYSSSTAISGSHFGSMEVPGDALPGAYRMRVIMKSGYQNDFTPCVTGFYGEGEDYTLKVRMRGCPAPEDLTLTELSSRNGAFSWKAIDNATEYWWAVEETGVDGPVAQGNTTSTSVSFTGLEPGKYYTFHVYANCSGDPGSAASFDFVALREYSSISLSGYNADIIAEGSQVPSETTTAGVDGNLGGSKVFYNETYNYLCVSPQNSLPNNEKIVSPNVDGLEYQLASATGNNSLIVSGSQSGSLLLQTPIASEALYLLATSGAGSSIVDVTIHFEDGSSQAFQGISIGDLSSSNNKLVKGFGKVSRDGSEFEEELDNLNLYEIELQVAFENHEKNIVSVGFQRTDLGNISIAHILAISSMDPVSLCMAPEGLVVSNITQNGADFEWNALNNVTEYSWVVVAEGEDPRSANSENSGSIDATSVILDFLEQGFTYDFYVRANYDDPDEGICWSKKLTFTTLNSSVCPEGDLSFSTQAEIDQFKIDFPDCTTITGNLEIQGTYFSNDVTNLEGLNNITTIYGHLLITYSSLPNLEDLSGLTSIGDGIMLSNNSSLINLDGLENISSLNGSLKLSSNHNLTSLEGLNNLESVGGDVEVRSNSSLNNLEALGNLTSIGEDLRFESNQSLTSFAGLGELTTVNGTLYITNNSSLESIEGLSNLTSAEGIDILENSILENIGTLSNIDVSNVSFDFLRISGNPLLSVCNLPNICTYLTKDPSTHWREISGNATDCISESAVVAACVGAKEYCKPSSSSVNSMLKLYINSFTTTGGIVNINNTSSGFSTNGYGNFSGTHSVNQVAGSEIGFTITPPTDENPMSYKIWIDWNKNYVFDEDEVMFKTTNAAWFSINGSFMVPTGTPDGSYRMRVMGVYDNEVYIVPCQNGFNGEMEDYSITVIQGGNSSVCEVPTEVIAISTTSDKSSFGWDSIDNAIEYEWIILEVDADLATATPILTGKVSEATVTVEGLEENTPYDFYVRSICDEDKTSDWSERTFFMTRTICPQGGGISFNSQFTIDQFILDYPGCTYFPGVVNIQESVLGDITNLDGLRNLAGIGGYLNIQSNSSLTNFDGLSSLETIGGALNIAGNLALSNLDGLSNLASVGGEFNIMSNPSLTVIDGMMSLTNVGGTLTISSNSQVVAISGLSQLQSIDGSISIVVNNSLSAITGLTSLESVRGGITIASNGVLTDISSLKNIDLSTEVAGRNLIIGGNPSLSVCNLPNFCDYLSNDPVTHPRSLGGNGADCSNDAAILATCVEPLVCPEGDLSFSTQAEVDQFKIDYPNCTEITGSVNIRGNDIENLDGLSNITSIGGELFMSENQGLVDLAGLSNLTFVGGDFTIVGNEFLNNVYGLNNLQKVGGRFMIEFNESLNNLDDLSSLESVEGYTFSISGNTSLTSVTGLSSLTKIDGDLIIAGSELLQNLNGLESLTAIRGFLVIEGNAILNDVSALSNIDASTIWGEYGLKISYNPELEVCNLPNFCTYLGQDPDVYPREIEGNKEDCISESSLLALCYADVEYCEPSSDFFSQFNGNYIESFSTFSAIENISNLVQGYSPQGYGDYTSNFSVVQYAGEVIEFTITPGTDYYDNGYKIWVDWNKNKVFEESEIVHTTHQMIRGIHQDSFWIPDGTPEGDYKMRVVVKTGATSNIDPCETGFVGEAEDYTISVLGLCPAPRRLTVTNLTTEGGTFTWDNIDKANFYEWVVVARGDSPTSGTSTVDRTVTVTGLDQDTNYDFFVRTDCDIDGASSWRKYSFTTCSSTLASIVLREVVQPNDCLFSNGEIHFDLVGLPLSKYTLSYTHNSLPIVRELDAVEGVIKLYDIEEGAYSDFEIVGVNCIASNSISVVLEGERKTWILDKVNSISCSNSVGSAEFSINIPDGTYEVSYAKTQVGVSNQIVYENINLSGGKFILSNLDVGVYAQLKLIAGCEFDLPEGFEIVDFIPELTILDKTEDVFCVALNGHIKFSTNLPDGVATLTYAFNGQNKNVSVNVKDGEFLLNDLAKGSYTTFKLTSNMCIATGSGTVVFSQPNVVASDFNRPSGCDSEDGSIGFSVSGHQQSSVLLSYRKDGILSTRTVNINNGTFALTGLGIGLYSHFSFTIGTCTITTNTTSKLECPCPSGNSVTLSSPTNDFNNQTSQVLAKKNTGSIIARNKVKGSSNISYEGASIELLPGFEVSKGSVFRAILGGCN